jgi:hypothetical protein
LPNLLLNLHHSVLERFEESRPPAFSRRQMILAERQPALQ